MYPDIETLKAILLKESYVSESDSKAAEAAAEGRSEAYVDFLIREELLTKSLLGQAIAEAYKVPYADLERTPPLKEDVAKIPEVVARANRVVYVKSNDQVVAVASDTPGKVNLQDVQAVFKDKRVRVAYTLPEYILAAFTLYAEALDTRFSTIIAAGKRVAPEIINEIIKDALTYRASDIHIEPQAESVAVRFRVDGALREAGRLPLDLYENILNRIKVESGMRIDEHHSAQDGAMRYQGEGMAADLRVSLVPTVSGEKVVMRVLGSYIQSYTLADLGLSERHRQQFESAAAKPFGMILTVGPTGSGKTTTLYALLKLLNKPDSNLTTIEDPVEYKIAGINQIQVRAASDLTFANGLRAIVRQDPDVILVGEIRDRETAEISVNAALTGHLMLSTFHSNDAATAVPRLIEMGIEPFLLASTLEVVIGQRLVRKICNHCRTTITAAEALAAIPLGAADISHFVDHKATFYSGKGCNVCSGSGYQGRSAVFEMINITPELQELITKDPSTQDVARLARKQHNPTMFEDGIEKAKNGVTTLAEVIRVVAPPKE